MAKILIIEDDPMVALALSDFLKSEGHTPEIVYNGADGLEALRHLGFDLAIVDWHLPELEGTEVCSNYRARGGRIPILMLTQKSNVIDKSTGLECGADDYLTKPFDIRELRARVRALLRRSTGLFDASRVSGKISLDYGEKTVNIHGNKVKLVPREFNVLEFLMRHPGTFFSAEKLLSHVWDSSEEVGHEAIRTCMSRLRSKLDVPGSPSVIETS
ncbi:MAG: response regulator transcription factor, partial [Cyanobacteria bacterium]|nr:response regulator transcription factor [Cyanobacteriota bacterium]